MPCTQPASGVPDAARRRRGRSKPPSRKAWTACSWAAASVAGAAGDVRGPGGLVHRGRPTGGGRRGPRRRRPARRRGRRRPGRGAASRSSARRGRPGRGRAAGERRRGRATLVEGAGQLAADQRGQHAGGPVARAAASASTSAASAHSSSVEEAARQVLGTQDVVPEEPLERRGVADRAALELGDEDARRGRRRGPVGGAAHVRDARRPARGPGGSGRRARRARSRAQAAAGVDGGDGGAGVAASAPRPASRTSATDRPAGRRTRSKPSVAALTSE